MNAFKLFFAMLCFTNFGCSDAAEKPEPSSETVAPRDPNYISETTEPFTGLHSGAEDDDERKRALLYAGIDSSYVAISKLDEIKNEINAEPAVGYSAQERNVRAKSILQLNMLSNMLARRVDSSMLVNLKEHTQQLQGINDGITKNLEHLQLLTERLKRAATILERVTNILAGCVSAGMVRPAIPAGVPAAQVKAGL